MLPSGIGQNEMIEPVIQELTGDADRDVAHVGEVGKTLLPGDMVLPEDHRALGAVLRRPGSHPPLKAPTQAVPVMIGMTALHLFQQGDRPQTWLGLEHGTDLAVPEPLERIGGLARPPPITGRG